MIEQIKLTKEAFSIDAQQWCSEIQDFIKEKFSESNRDGIVVTISGGLDSSVTAALCTCAIGKDKVIGLMLPERWGNPEANAYGRLIAIHLGIGTKKINISPILSGLGTSDFLLSVTSGRSFWQSTVNKLLKKSGHSTKRDYFTYLQGDLEPWWRKMIAKVNSKNRARVLAVYKFAEENNLVVVGSAHKSEGMVGLFVKYGIDDCADIMPLKNIFRSHILQLGEFLGIPDEILHRSPNPDILPGVTDKYLSYFGMDFSQVDLILLGLEKGLAVREIADQLGLDEEPVKEMEEAVRLSEY
ncbi:NAD(+) synthase, partial [bacterium]|nr:NAD(+) synthase [bacterium]